jgi:hypothetical protein
MRDDALSHVSFEQQLGATRQAARHLGRHGHISGRLELTPMPIRDRLCVCPNSKSHCNFIRPSHPDLDQYHMDMRELVL